MSSRHLLEAFERWKAEGQSLVLATVYATSGSTYSKPGARMLITADGRFQGMLSGGCLEGDLAERASAVLRTGEPQAVTYDLGGVDEELWGLGVGCDGVMQIFLQPILQSRGYEPFATMARAWQDDCVWLAATIIESSSPSIATGATLITNGMASTAHDVAAPEAKRIGAAAAKVLSGGRSECSQLTLDDGEAKVLYGIMHPAPRLLVLGGGLDAIPLVKMAVELGWVVTVVDHRSAYLANDRFAVADRCLCVPAESVTEHLALDGFQCAIVMSHHLQTDRTYLQQLAKVQLPYVGLLGPPARRERLLDQLGEQGELLRGHLYGPAGLDIAADDPASIALSILAQMQQVLKKDD